VAGATRTEDGQSSQAMSSVLMGVLALLVEEREQRIQGDRSSVRTELVLARVGMSPDDIAAVMGKNKDAVRMAISRAKAA